MPPKTVGRRAHRALSKDPAEQLRAICLALPEAAEVAMKRGPTFRINDKIFAMDRRIDGRACVWCKAPAGSQAILIGADPRRFFVPPYVGSKGWVGLWLDDEPDWNEVAALIRRSYRLIAPKHLSIRVG